MKKFEVNKKYSDESERIGALNSTITLGLLVFYTIIIGFTLLTLSKNNNIIIDIISIVASILFSGISIYLYRKDKYSHVVHKQAIYSFLMTYALTFMLAGRSYMQFTIFAVLIINILFYNEKNMRYYVWITCLINIGYLIRMIIILSSVKDEVSIGVFEARTIEEVVIKLIFTLCMLYAVQRATIRGMQFHGGMLSTLMEQNKLQEDMLNHILEVSNLIGENTNMSSEMIMELEGSTQNVSDLISSISNSSEQTVANIQEQMSMTQSIQMSIEQTVENSKDMVQLANNSNENIAKSFRILRKLKEQADMIKVANKDVVEALGNLQSNSKEVKDIADLIIGISNQTNLLALNASIESARAGEAGKGFAVVASEIGKLASETKKAIERILDISNNLNNNADISVNSVQSTIKTTTNQDILITKVLESFNQINGNIESLTSDITQIDTMIDNLAKSNDIIVSNISTISSVTEGIASDAKEAADLSNSNIYAQRIVQDFLQEVKNTSSKLDNLKRE